MNDTVNHFTAENALDCTIFQVESQNFARLIPPDPSEVPHWCRHPLNLGDLKSGHNDHMCDMSYDLADFDAGFRSLICDEVVSYHLLHKRRHFLWTIKSNQTKTVKIKVT